MLHRSQDRTSARLATILVGVVLATAVHAATSDLQDVVYLTNGSVVRGVIVEHRLGEAIVIAIVTTVNSARRIVSRLIIRNSRLG